MPEVIYLPAPDGAPLGEQQAWELFLQAVDELRNDHPNVDVRKCRRVVETYEAFYRAMQRSQG